MTTYFTADTHFGCGRLRKHTRSEFTTIEEHDEALLDGINRTVSRGDQLVIVGDFCLKKPGRYRPKIKCRHIFYVLGNHDKMGAIQRSFGGHVWWHKMIKLERGMVWACHYPTAYWPQSHYGAFHAYGHLHASAEREVAMDSAFPGRRSMDVGVDSAYKIFGDYRPFSSDEFFDLLAGQEGHDIIRRD